MPTPRHRMQRARLALPSLAAAFALSLSPSGCSCDPPPPDAGPGTDSGPRTDAGPGTDAGPPLEGLVVPAGAVGCELLLIETGGPIRVDFGAATQGTSVREAPKVAVAAVSGGALEIAVAGAFELASSRCVDAAGEDVGEAKVAE